MRCCVYAIVVDGVIRYIGKGSASGGKLSRFHDHIRAMRRLIRHRAEGLPAPQKVSGSTIANELAHAWLDGAEISELVVADGLGEEDALQQELALINNAPAGQLWNKPQQWGYLLQAARSRRLSPESRGKIAEGIRRHWADPDCRAKHQAALRGVRKRNRADNVISLKQEWKDE
jgi:hypothetical protein